jgi:hypothetical protein
MKTTLTIFTILLLGLTAAAQAPDLNELAWMTGTWIGSGKGMQMEEHWTAPKGNSMLGMHRDVAGDRTVSFEFLRIEKTSAGMAYIAQPQGGSPTRFLMVESSKTRVVFENKMHDFPQRIIYWIEQNNLHARVEGPLNGRQQAMEWTWRKAS